MSAAAGSRAVADRRRRLREFVGWVDEAFVSGRLPALLIVIVTGLMLWAFLFTNDFRVETVAVEGLTYGDGSEVVERSALLDRSAFQAQTEVVAAQIAELPYVEQATVDVRFPGRATIRIVERQPVLNVELDDHDSLVSSEGTPIASGFVEGLPLLRLDNRGEPLEDALSPEVVSAVQSVAAIFGPDATLSWNPDIGLVMEMPGGGLVSFGLPENMDAKLAVLTAIEDQLDESWTQLDLSVPTRPAYR